MGEYYRTLKLFNLSEPQFKKLDRSEFIEIADRYIIHSAAIIGDGNFDELDTGKTNLLKTFPPEPKSKESSGNKLNWWDRVKPKG